MKTFAQLVEETRAQVEEIMPWDLADKLNDKELLLVDIREPYEFEAMHIAGSINVPRGVLETACEYNYEETVPVLADARDRQVVLVCRSGNRSVFAAQVLQQLGFQQPLSLKTGLRGWNDFEQPLVDQNNQPVDIDTADEYFTSKLRPEQQKAG